MSADPLGTRSPLPSSDDMMANTSGVVPLLSDIKHTFISEQTHPQKEIKYLCSVSVAGDQQTNCK